MAFSRTTPSPDSALKLRTQLDALLGAVNTHNIAYTYTSLHFKKSDLLQLYDDPDYPYRSEEAFLQAISKRFAGCTIDNTPSANTITVRLSPETKNEALIQLAAVQAVAYPTQLSRQ